MPSVSPAQARLMRAAAHGFKKPGGGGPSVAVGKEFMHADEAKKGNRSRSQKADRKRSTSKWAEHPAKRAAYAAMDT
jgi:hypothetical protein